MKEDPRYPLVWPIGWKRTPSAERGAAPFREQGVITRQVWDTTLGRYVDRALKGDKPVSLRAACRRLQDQLERLGATGIILSTNVQLTVGGEPRGDRREPDDPGAAVYFEQNGHDRVLACDKWATVAGNVAALAQHIDAIRRVERYGVGTLEQVFSGYDRLPPPSEENRPPWRGILGFKPLANVTVDDVQVNYRALAKSAGLDQTRLVQLNLARDAAVRELSG
jgi:hypothetical protein